MRTARGPVPATVALLALTLPLAACGSDGEEPEGQAPITADSTPAPGDTGSGPDVSAAPTGEPTTGPVGAVPPAGAEEGGVFAAIELAEEEAGGTAFEVDREDGSQGWTVSVAVENREIDVEVDQSGSLVLRSDDGDDLDADERAALDSAQVPIAGAVRTALGEVGGTLDDVTLDEGDGTVAWQVGIDDVEVLVDVVTGEVLRVDRD